MRLLLCLFVCLLLSSCSGNKEPHPDPGAGRPLAPKPRAKDQLKGVAKFSEMDPKETLRWIHERTLSLMEAVRGDNDLAKDRAVAAYKARLNEMVGKTIRWPAQVGGVTKEGISVLPLTYPATLREVQEFDRKLERDEKAEPPVGMFPGTSFGLGWRPLLNYKDADWAASLKPGATVEVVGVIREVRFDGGGKLPHVIFGSTLVVEGEVKPPPALGR